jgi:nucleoside-diphosphate-sugar epimerase
MVTKLTQEGYWVRGVDIKDHQYSSIANDFMLGDLTNPNFVTRALNMKSFIFDEIYQFAADMGGAGYIFTGDHDADVMYNSSMINLNVLKEIVNINKANNLNQTKIFYSSSACIYPEHTQQDPNNPDCRESSAYPANPDSEYGWEKLFSERLYFAFHKNYNIPVRVARYHNIFGPEGTWRGGREKSPAAICRKVAMAQNYGEVEIWGDGEQTRSFLYIDECIEATYRLMQSDFIGPINIGSEEMVTINKLVDMACEVSGKKLNRKHIDGPLGVRGRNSNNDLIRKELGWDYSMSLKDGIKKTYEWINEQIKNEYKTH